MPKFISRGQIRKLSEIHRGRPGGIMTELTVFATEQGAEVGEAQDPMALLDPLMEVEDQREQGLGPMIQEFIVRLVSGGLARSEVARVLQAKVLWDLGFGGALGLGSSKQYLNGTDAVEPIPALPVWPAVYPSHLKRNVLVDKRVLEQVGLSEVCRLSRVKFSGNDNTLVPHKPEQTKSGIYWMRAQDGRRYHRVSPRLCRTEHFAACEVGQEAFEGLSLFVQDRGVKQHIMDLPGSVLAERRNCCAHLFIMHDRPRLGWSPDCSGTWNNGSASRGLIEAPVD